MNYPAAPGHKPTTEQLRKLWMDRMPYASVPEKIESEIGFRRVVGRTSRRLRQVT